MNLAPERNRLHLLLPLSAGGCALLILLFPQQASEGVRGAMQLCFDSLIPALFPFLILTRILLSSGAARILGIPLSPLCRLLHIRRTEAGCAVAIGFLGGFAAAGCSIDALYRDGKLTGRQAELLLCSCACEGPAFVIAAVGSGMLGSIEVGVLLFISLVPASLLSAIIIARFLPSDPYAPSLEKKEHTAQHGASIFVDAVSSSVDAILRICGFVLFFGLLQGLLSVFSLPDSLSSLLLALLEVSTGCRTASALGGAPAVLLCTLSLSALGLSAFAQLRALISPEIRLWPLALSRLLHFPLTLGIFSLLSRFLPDTVSVFEPLGNPQAWFFPFRLPKEAAFFLFLFLAVFCSELAGSKALRKGKKKV